VRTSRRSKISFKKAAVAVEMSLNAVIVNIVLVVTINLQFYAVYINVHYVCQYSKQQQLQQTFYATVSATTWCVKTTEERMQPLT